MSKHNMIDREKPRQIIEDHLSKFLRVKARAILREALELEMEIFMKDYQSYRLFVDMYEAKYPKATHCLIKDQETLMAFYGFPAEHWRHLRTSNPIESTFATVKLRTAKIRGCFSRKTVLTMAFKLMESAQKNWIRLHGFKRLAEVIEGVQFVNEIPHTGSPPK